MKRPTSFHTYNGRVLHVESEDVPIYLKDGPITFPSIEGHTLHEGLPEHLVVGDVLMCSGHGAVVLRVVSAQPYVYLDYLQIPTVAPSGWDGPGSVGSWAFKLNAPVRFFRVKEIE